MHRSTRRGPVPLRSDSQAHSVDAKACETTLVVWCGISSSHGWLGHEYVQEWAKLHSKWYRQCKGLPIRHRRPDTGAWSHRPLCEASGRWTYVDKCWWDPHPSLCAIECIGRLRRCSWGRSFNATSRWHQAEAPCFYRKLEGELMLICAWGQILLRVCPILLCSC